MDRRDGGKGAGEGGVAARRSRSPGVVPVAASLAARPIAYERHRPRETTVLYELVRDNLETLYGANCGLLCRGTQGLSDCTSNERDGLASYWPTYPVAVGASFVMQKLPESATCATVTSALP